jgi:hypothetical protein
MHPPATLPIHSNHSMLQFQKPGSRLLHALWLATGRQQPEQSVLRNSPRRATTLIVGHVFSENDALRTQLRSRPQFRIGETRASFAIDCQARQIIVAKFAQLAALLAASGATHTGNTPRDSPSLPHASRPAFRTKKGSEPTEQIICFSPPQSPGNLPQPHKLWQTCAVFCSTS